MRHRRLLRAAALSSPVVLAAALATTATIAQAQTSHPASPVSPAGLSPAQARALSSNVTDKVIVLFKNQVASLPDTSANSAVRASAVRSLQAGVLSELAQTHATNVHSISLVNALSATVSPGMATLLATNPAVAEVVPDLPIPVASASPFTPTAGHAITPLPGACAPKGQVQLNPEAILNIHAAGSATSAQALGYTGAGVKVAYIADGIDINNPDFIRANGSHVFVDYQDFSGTGTNAPTSGGEAFLDASSIAAQGREHYNVASYAVGLSTPCNIRILGVAPGASLVGLNVFGSSNVAYNSVFLRAIDYAVSVDHVNVINESFGANPFPDNASLDLTRMADDNAVKAGVTVTASTGDAGVTNTIGSPATDPNVLSAGASTTYRGYAQSGIAGITLAKGWIDNNISGLSSGGFDQAGGTVDVVAPGDLNWALCTPNLNKYAACSNFAGKPASVELTGGTSESSPLTAGTAALVIQAFREAHHGKTPTPAQVKQIIVSTAQNINAPADQQGAGMIDAYQAVLAARSYKGASVKPAGHAILASPTQLNWVGQAGSTAGFSPMLTNDGASTVTLQLSSRTLGAYTPVSTKTLTLTAAGGYEAIVKFTVPAGQARLNASVSMPGVDNISLISPSGRFAAYNLPQGPGSYGNAQVASPQAGTWTALISGGGTGGPLTAHFQASTATWQPFGSLTAHSVTLKPGTSAMILWTAPLSAQAGDQSGSILVHSSATSPAFATETTIPITLRSLVPTPDPSSTVTGTLTGGNGRGSNTGQTAYYQVQIPSGLPALNVSVDTGNANNTLFASLIDPSGEAASTASNGLMVTTATGFSEIKPEVGAQLHVLKPAAGLWTLAVNFYASVSGTAVSQPFTITLNDTPVTASVSSLPDSASTELAPGTPVTALVTVTNNGTTPEAYFIDPRLSHETTLNLATQTTPVVPLPNVFGAVPAYIVPSHTTSFTTMVSSPDKLYYDDEYNFGDPDLPSGSGTNVKLTYSAPDIESGAWTVTPFLYGPTGAKAPSTVTAHVSMTATTAAFDHTVTAPTGDMWAASTSEFAGFTPYVVNPGGSVTIPVTITPSGAAGTVVSGTLYLSDSSLDSSEVTQNNIPGEWPSGSDVAAFPYTYTIG